MPELPEVETTRRGVHPHIVGRTIEKAIVRDARLRWPVPREFARRVEQKKITGTARRGKYLLIELAGGARVIVHLGMTGRLSVRERGHPLRKHDHIDLELSGGLTLRFGDPRRFGAVLFWPADEPTHKLLSGMGPEPLSDDFSGAHLFDVSRGRSAAVKNFIMDGRVVVGVGNIYASEALFRARIKPQRAAGKVTRAQYELLAKKIRDVLDDAIKAGGTTLRDYSGAHGEPGEFKQKLYVYDRAGRPCLRCKTPIRRLVLGQRSSFYCPSC
ncbi:MAG TPA: bifunctional DNA-formamidopyrimidine glycosylase/DNA-(apurinic or apyrimidinic site) lyase, partial [Nevskiaceae bacterium]|nr:bifunctional DNA-formamidopyrimidine glycosylase/DNA-(apurinic or apyrimidinic site) lyase [Nevskiaceae bacterium]